MTQPGTFEITTTKGHVYHIDAPDEATAQKVGQQIDEQEQGGATVDQMSFPGTNAEVGEAFQPTPPPVQSEAPKNGFLDTGMGLALRNLMKGATALPGLALDSATLASHPDNPFMVSQGVGSGVDKVADTLGMRDARSGDEGRTDRIVGAGFQGLGGAGTMGGVAPVGAAMGGMGGQTVAENGGTPMEQFAASLALGAAPGLAKTATGAAVRGVVRGSDPTAVREAVDTFKTAGTVPTVADATGGSKATAIEGFLSQLFGSGGVVRKRRLQQEQQIGENLGKRADELYPSMSNEDMGAYISSNAEEGFKPQGRSILDAKYNLLEKHLPSDTRVDISPFRDFVAKKSAVNPAAPRTTTNPIVGGEQGNWASLGKDLDADMKNILAKTGKGGLPLDAIKELRTRIGRKIEDAAFDESGGNIADLRGAYGVLSETMKDAARKAGPKAEKAFNDATQAASWYHNILESVKPVIDKAGGFEKVFTTSLAGTKDGGTTIRNVYSLLSPDARQAMTSQILRRAAKPAGADPEAFDMVRFARNYANMDDEAKKVIFPQQQSDLDQVSKAILTMQKSKEEGGVASSAAQGRVGVQAALQSPVYMAAGVGAGAAASHPILGLLAGSAVPAGMGGARMLAKWMMNPKTVHFLAETTKLPVDQVPLAVNNFIQQAQRSNDPDEIELAKYLQSQQEQE